MSSITKNFITAIALLLIANVFLWHNVLSFANPDSAYYFLDVGQGDSSLLIFPGGVKLLIDGGPGSKLSHQLDKILPAGDKYIDIVLMTHPQLDHFEGLIDVVKNYDVGVFLSPGRERDMSAYNYLLEQLDKKQIRHIALGAGDSIGYEDIVIDVLSPTLANLKSKELNDTGVVLMINQDGIRSLLTADVGGKLEKAILKKYNLDADILKVGHHGSKYSTGKEFLAEVTPKISLIEVGKNSYGHPTKDTLSRLASIGSQVFRTDQSGNIKITFAGGKLKVYNLR